MNVWLRCLKWWWKITVPLRLRLQGVQVGKGCTFYGMPIVSVHKNSSIFIGDRVVLCSDSRFTALGVNHPVILRTMQVGGKITISSDVGISGATICAATDILIGCRTLIGANVSIIDTDFHAIEITNRRYCQESSKIKKSPIQIGQDVFIGASAIILKGVSIGCGSVVGANSVVTNNLEKNAIFAGNPAKFIKSISSELL